MLIKMNSKLFRIKIVLKTLWMLFDSFITDFFAILLTLIFSPFIVMSEKIFKWWVKDE